MYSLPSAFSVKPEVSCVNKNLPLPMQVAGGSFFIASNIQLACLSLLLVQSQVNIHGASYRATYHGVVANTQEAHHLNVSRN